ncbi:MAG: mechanosensitive ion channel [Alcaligenaceae bacterium]|jgi:miniconductance mechanosensitive channel|nr:mechanosensitive ion channel [Alcaligenaceae bacterium]
MRESILNLLKHVDLAENELVVKTVFFLVALTITLLAYTALKLAVDRGFRRLLRKAKGSFLSVLGESKALHYAYLVIVVRIFSSVSALLFKPDDDLLRLIVVVSHVLMIIFFALALAAFINVIGRMASRNKKFEALPIQGFQQTLKLVLTVIAILLIVSTLLGQSIGIVISGFGAMTAISMLVFQNPIMGFVAGIQIAANNMLKVGDWLEMPKYNADGDVIEIGLTTVKVQNFDKTVTTIPTSALISDSFKNWRGMRESGGRRIKRKVYVDINSIHFIDEAKLREMSGSRRLADYLSSKNKEIAQYNEELDVDGLARFLDERKMTNVGTFRAYIVAYLKQHPRIHKDMISMVRQLEPTSEGLPLEIYCFTNTTNWVEYEGIQSDIFDHIFAVANAFDLRLFQQPTGHDWRAVAEYALRRDNKPEQN